MIIGTVIITDSRHEGVIYYTANPKKYWSSNLRMAKIYKDEKECDRKLRTLHHNNPRKCVVDVHEMV